MTQKLTPCPICTTPTTIKLNENPYRPFCSDRCRLIDLGNWLGEKHAIPGEPVDPLIIQQLLDED